MLVAWFISYSLNDIIRFSWTKWCHKVMNFCKVKVQSGQKKGPRWYIWGSNRYLSVMKKYLSALLRLVQKRHQGQQSPRLLFSAISGIYKYRFMWQADKFKRQKDGEYSITIKYPFSFSLQCSQVGFLDQFSHDSQVNNVNNDIIKNRTPILQFDGIHWCCCLDKLTWNVRGNALARLEKS